MKAIKTQSMQTGFAARLIIAVIACAMAFMAVMLIQPAQKAHADSSQNMFRLYNPNTGEHFYTAEANENNALIGLGWKPEGDAWRAPNQGEPVYRMYNPNGVGEHHYTMDSSEVTDLERAGWINEGIRWYSDPANNQALHSLYNPNAFANNHHYTADQNEIQALQELGWVYENEKWYGVIPGQYYADIDVKDYGTIRVALNASAAPKTVENFVKLANKGFYDGLSFHRIMPGWMMQGGDPQGNGYGGSGQNIYGEFAQNNWNDNYLTHKRGAISMARASDPNSASSQFFIMHQDDDNSEPYQLDGKYAAFGCVMSGIEVVDKICENAKPIDNNGTIAKDQRPIINTVKIGTF